jgi:putative peptidoglycan lipid II flippase
MELALFLSLPAAVALVVSATPLIQGVFEHGAFLPADTIGTASALAAFSLGVPAYVLIKVLTPGFYARQDTKTPVRLAVWSMLVNLIGNLALIWLLGGQWGHVGVAAATAVAAWVNAMLLYITLHKRGHLQMDARFRTKSVRIIGAATVMGVALWFLNPVAIPHLSHGLLERVLWLGILCGAGALVYFVSVVIFSRKQMPGSP